MNRWLLVWLCAFAVRGLAAEEAGGSSASRIVSRLSPGLVRVEYRLQFDKGDAPVGVIGDELRAEHNRRGLLAALVEEDRPAEAAGFLVAPDEVVTFTPDLHPRFIQSIRVHSKGGVEDARIVAHARDTWGVKLKLARPLPQTTPLKFASRPGKPRHIVHYYRNNGLWGVHLGGFPSDTMHFETGRTIRPMESVGLVVAADGEPLGLALDNLPPGDSWQGTPQRWAWVSDPDMSTKLEGLKQVLSQGVVHVRLSLRSPKGTPASRQRRMDRDDDEGEEATERDALGVVLGGNRVAILSELKPRTTARLQRITVFVGDKQVGARFVASLKDFGVLVAEAEAPLGPALPLAEGDLGRYLDILTLRGDVYLQGENRTEYLRPGRISGMRRGPKGALYPELLDDAGAVAWIFSLDTKLVVLPVERRDPLTSRRERFGGNRNDIRPTHASVLAKAIADLPATADPANAPVTEAEENRLAWLGVELQPLTRELARANGVADQTRDGESGALVTYVHPDSPAAKAGITSGAILVRLRVPGQPLPVEVRLDEDQMRSGTFPWERLDQIGEQFFDRIPTPWAPAENNFTRALTDLGFGTKFTAEFFVDGKPVAHEFDVVPGPTHYESAARYKSEALGLTVRELTYDVRRYMQRRVDEPGVVVGRIEPGGKASVAGVKPFELITHVNDQPVASVADFEKFAAAGGELKLSIKRMAKGRIVTVKAGK